MCPPSRTRRVVLAACFTLTLATTAALAGPDGRRIEQGEVIASMSQARGSGFSLEWAEAAGPAFERAAEVTVEEKHERPYMVQLVVPVSKAIAEGDVLHLRFRPTTIVTC